MGTRIVTQEWLGFDPVDNVSWTKNVYSDGKVTYTRIRIVGDQLQWFDFDHPPTAKLNIGT